VRPPLRGNMPSEHPAAGPIPRAIFRVPVRGRRSKRRRRFIVWAAKFSHQLFFDKCSGRGVDLAMRSIGGPPSWAAAAREAGPRGGALLGNLSAVGMQVAGAGVLAPE